MIERLPVWFLSMALLLATIAVVWQMMRGDALVCSDGAIFQKSCSETLVSDNLVLWESAPLRLSAGEDETVTHSLGGAPSFVQVWSSSSRLGPWSLIDSIAANYGSPVSTYGVWVHSGSFAGGGEMTL